MLLTRALLTVLKNAVWCWAVSSQFSTTGVAATDSSPTVCSTVCFCVQVESALGVEGDDMLYVGDHIYTDAALAKINFRSVTWAVMTRLLP